MTDYTIKENRIKALDKLNSDCLKTFKDSGIELSKDAIVDVNENSIEISFREPDKTSSYYGRAAFGSEIRIFPRNESFRRVKECEISVGSSGSFTPEHKSAYWRTVHAAEVLENWETACLIVNTYCKKYDDLSKEIHEQNKSTPTK